MNKTQAPMFDRKANAIRLTVLSGPDAGQVVPLDRPSLIIGSGSTAEFRLSDASVESEHVLLVVQPDGVRLRDLSNAGGASVANMRVRDALFTGSVTITIGNTTLLVEIDSAAPPVAVEKQEAANVSELLDLPYREARARALEAFDHAYISTMLAQSKNVVTHAARRAGIERESFHRIMQRARVKRPSRSL